MNSEGESRATVDTTTTTTTIEKCVCLFKDGTYGFCLSFLLACLLAKAGRVIYIYIYVCVCVCISVHISHHLFPTYRLKKEDGRMKGCVQTGSQVSRLRYIQKSKNRIYTNQPFTSKIVRTFSPLSFPEAKTKTKYAIHYWILIESSSIVHERNRRVVGDVTQGGLGLELQFLTL